MDYLNSFAISSAGMGLERTRLNVASLNIANANVAFSASAPVRPLQLLSAPVGAVSFEQLMNGQMAKLVSSGVAVQEVVDVEPRMAYEPQHPYADSKGFVRYPAVNMANEMISLMTAVRGYEANVVAFNAAKVMAQKAIDLGGAR
ncbi:MAG: flagellar basal body rod protein FlgC [Rhodocyclaceae bacterium]